MFNIVITSSEEKRTGWLFEVSKIANKYYPNTKDPELGH